MIGNFKFYNFMFDNSRPSLVTYGTTEQYELQRDTASKKQKITYIHVDTEGKRKCFFLFNHNF